MKLKIYAIKDKAMGFTDIFLCNGKYEAMRRLNDAVNNQQTNIISQHPGDFSLFELGDFDQDTGAITPTCLFIEEALALKKKEK